MEPQLTSICPCWAFRGSWCAGYLDSLSAIKVRSIKHSFWSIRKKDNQTITRSKPRCLCCLPCVPIWHIMQGLIVLQKRSIQPRGRSKCSSAVIARTHTACVCCRPRYHEMMAVSSPLLSFMVVCIPYSLTTLFHFNVCIVGDLRCHVCFDAQLVPRTLHFLPSKVFSIPHIFRRTCLTLPPPTLLVKLTVVSDSDVPGNLELRKHERRA